MSVHACRGTGALRARVLSAWILVIAAPGAWAATGTSLQVGGGCNPVVGGTLLDWHPYCDASDQASDVPAGSVIGTSGQFIDPGVGTANSARWSASAGFGVVRGDSTATVSTQPAAGGTPKALGISASTFALAGDQFTLDAPGLTGQAGHFTASLLVEGSMSGSVTDAAYAWGFAGWEAQLGISSNGHLLGIVHASGDSSDLNPVKQSLTVDIDFIFGQALEVGIGLWTYAAAAAYPGGAVGTPGYATPVSATMSAIFSNTAAWQGFSSVTMANGTAVTDWTVTSASGTDYAQALGGTVAATVPEPQTWALWLLGAGALLAFRAVRSGSERARKKPVD